MTQEAKEKAKGKEVAPMRMGMRKVMGMAVGMRMILRAMKEMKKSHENKMSQ